MAETSLRSDSCTYQEELKRSVGPGIYMLNTPAADCGKDCNRDIPADPSLRYQAWGPGSCAPGSAVDDGSELWGINYKASRCSTDAYAPGKYSAKGACSAPGKSDPRSCSAPQESCRLSNPPCTLRGTGWNRWEWLCWDPQDRALIPFEWNVPYRIVVKDNHTPNIEQPLDESAFLPGGKDSRNWNIGDFKGSASCGMNDCAPGNPFAVYSLTESKLAQM